MLEILQFIFSSFWIFIGTIALIISCGITIAMLSSIKGGNTKVSLIDFGGKDND